MQENAGVYNPGQHQRALERVAARARSNGEPTAAERVTANVRRLERLARFRLAVRLADGRWQVPTDLVAQLEAREKTHPQHRIRIHPIVEWERDELGRTIARTRRRRIRPRPRRIRGRCFACEPTPSGAEFVRVVDEAGRRFTLIPKAAADSVRGPDRSRWRATSADAWSIERGAGGRDKSATSGISPRTKTGKEHTMEAAKKRAGRPKAVARTRPLVLEDEADAQSWRSRSRPSTASDLVGIRAVGGAVVLADDGGGHLEDRRFRTAKGFPARRALAGTPPRRPPPGNSERAATETFADARRLRPPSPLPYRPFRDRALRTARRRRPAR